MKHPRRIVATVLLTAGVFIPFIVSASTYQQTDDAVLQADTSSLLQGLGPGENFNGDLVSVTLRIWAPFGSISNGVTFSVNGYRKSDGANDQFIAPNNGDGSAGVAWFDLINGMNEITATYDAGFTFDSSHCYVIQVQEGFTGPERLVMGSDTVVYAPPITSGCFSGAGETGPIGGGTDLESIYFVMQTDGVSPGIIIDPAEGDYWTTIDIEFTSDHLYMFHPDGVNYFGEITTPGTYETSLVGLGSPNQLGTHTFVMGDSAECAQGKTLTECLTDIPSAITATYENIGVESLQSRITSVVSPTQFEQTETDTVTFEYEFFSGDPLVTYAGGELVDTHAGQSIAFPEHEITATGPQTYTENLGLVEGHAYTFRPYLRNTTGEIRIYGTPITFFVIENEWSSFVPRNDQEAEDIASSTPDLGQTATVSGLLMQRPPFLWFKQINDAYASSTQTVGSEMPTLTINMSDTIIPFTADMFSSTTLSKFIPEETHETIYGTMQASIYAFGLYALYRRIQGAFNKDENEI